jgi:hypothetical protein
MTTTTRAHESAALQAALARQIAALQAALAHESAALQAALALASATLPAATVAKLKAVGCAATRDLRYLTGAQTTEEALVLAAIHLGGQIDVTACPATELGEMLAGPDWAQQAQHVWLGVRQPLELPRLSVLPRLAANPAPAAPAPAASPAAEDSPGYVDLDQMAALVQRSKSALEKLKRRKVNPLPPPDIEGGGGKKGEWLWTRIRPWLEAEYGKRLPRDCPTRLR